MTRPPDHNGFAYRFHLKENSGQNKSSIVDAAVTDLMELIGQELYFAHLLTLARFSATIHIISEM